MPPSETVRPDHIPEKFWDPVKGEPKVEQLAVSYINLEKQFSQKREIKHPGDKATPEQLEAYHAEVRKITGAPDKPEGYGLRKPDNLPEGVNWNQETADKAAAIAHKHGISQAALHELIAVNNESITGMMAQSKEQEETQRAEMISSLNKEWGADAPNNWGRAKRGALALGIDTSKSELANNPEFIRAALQVDKMIREDSGLVHGDNEAATYQEQLERLQKSDDFQGKNGPEKAQAALERMKGLHNAINKVKQ